MRPMKETMAITLWNILLAMKVPAAVKRFADLNVEEERLALLAFPENDEKPVHGARKQLRAIWQQKLAVAKKLPPVNLILLIPIGRLRGISHEAWRELKKIVDRD